MGKGEERGSLGIAYNYIKNFNLSNGRFYENDICVIHKGIINTTTKRSEREIIRIEITSNGYHYGKRRFNSSREKRFS